MFLFLVVSKKKIGILKDILFYTFLLYIIKVKLGNNFLE